MPSSNSASNSTPTAENDPNEQVCFVEAEEANIEFLGKHSWCQLSERRLINKLALYKPVGLKKNFNLFALMHALHYITEDEDDVDFEEYLRPDDYMIYLDRQKSPQRDVMIFPPRYRFRPTREEVVEKIREFYDIDLLSKYDPVPTEIQKEYCFDPSLCLRKKAL